jgi:integrase/recombinase XerD
MIDHFLRSLPTTTSRIAAQVAIGHARRIAPHRFSTQQQATPDPDGLLLVSYLDHFRHVRGLEPRTCEGLVIARRTLVWYHGHAPVSVLPR